MALSLQLVGGGFDGGDGLFHGPKIKAVSKELPRN
jgi:hypothetical protein